MVTDSLKADGATREDTRQQIVAASRRSKVDAEQAGALIEVFLKDRTEQPLPTPAQLEELLNDVAVPAWKILGAHQALGAMVEGEFFSPSQIVGCLTDCREEVVSRSRGLLILRDRWKAGEYPTEGSGLVTAIVLTLQPFYLAAGAVEVLEFLKK